MSLSPYQASPHYKAASRMSSNEALPFSFMVPVGTLRQLSMGILYSLTISLAEHQNVCRPPSSPLQHPIYASVPLLKREQILPHLPLSSPTANLWQRCSSSISAPGPRKTHGSAAVMLRSWTGTRSPWTSTPAHRAGTTTCSRTRTTARGCGRVWCWRTARAARHRHSHGRAAARERRGWPESVPEGGHEVPRCGCRGCARETG